MLREFKIRSFGRGASIKFRFNYSRRELLGTAPVKLSMLSGTIFIHWFVSNPTKLLYRGKVLRQLTMIVNAPHAILHIWTFTATTAGIYLFIVAFSVFRNFPN
ncbi:hypothetical protein PPYR_09940 [Photinus pyralis]|uniref:Uncharacterized protein n=1 Tax=Photinus pyralis TaxID=7054 RepID=A0A5N4AEZ9_PHOPY|nr:hypothetical protein PPYR_09940 [Photinus pyralis]